MKGVLQLASFGLGAALSSAVLRGLGEGTPADPRSALKEGVRLWLTIVNAAGAAQAEFDAFQAELRAEPENSPARAETRRRIALEPPA